MESSLSQCRAALAAFLLGLLLDLSVTLPPPAGSPGVIVLDLQIQESSRTKVFWNEFDRAPLAVANPGGRRVIELPITTVYRLRIDPSDKPSETVALYRVTFRLNDGSERDVPLTEIADSWAFIDTSSPAVVDGALAFRSTTRPPYI